MKPDRIRAFALAWIAALWCTCCFAQARADETPATSATAAASDPGNDNIEARFKNLAQELRCLVCQNQTLFDSTAPLAADLREQIRKQLGEGSSDSQIRAFMVERYGDFILYKPPLKATTLLLWGIPFALLLLGVGLLARMMRRAQAVDTSQANLSESDRDPASTARLRSAREWLDGAG